MTTDCPQKSTTRICPRCKQLVLEEDEWEEHTKKKTCRRKFAEPDGAIIGKLTAFVVAAPKGNAVSRCPLCHADILGGEGGWKAHLLGIGPDACTANPRRPDRSSDFKKPSVTNKGATGVGVQKGVALTSGQKNR